jgi:DNA-binding GntR family transcriptional regulator
MSDKATMGLSVPSLTDALYQAVRAQIFNGQIGAGEVVTEVGLAERFSVARPTAKAAVERLVHDGLLQRSQNKSASVPVLGLADVRELYWTRALLEREIFRELADRRYVSPVALRYVRDLQDLVDAPVLTAVMEADIGFHSTLVAQLENARLSRLYDSVMGEMHLCMAQVQLHRLLHPGRIAAEHQLLIEAIEDGDQERAMQEVCLHLERARDRLIAYLEGDSSEVDLGERKEVGA